MNKRSFMKMTKNALMTALALAGALSWQPQTLCAAQDKPAGGQRLAQFRERMQDTMKELNLSDEQKEKLKPIWQEQMQKMRELWQDQSLSRQEKMEKFKAVQKEMQSKLKEILTAEQLQKWEKQRGAQGRAGLQEALKDLNLTDDQKAKLKPLWQAQAEKLRELRGDKNLLPQEKMEKFKAVQDEMEPKLRQILTGEQFDKWQKQREKMRGQAKDRWQTK
jgi:Spy/CpxP family protein refolding chaperone